MGTFQNCLEPYWAGPLAWEHLQMKTACGCVQEGRQCPGSQVHASLTLTLPAQNPLPWSLFPSHPPIIFTSKIHKRSACNLWGCNDI